jgi:Ino eighty subunit 1
MWWYLESDFSAEAAEKNPFGPGLLGSEGDATNGMPIKCPAFKHLTDAEIAAENVDTEEEKTFGENKRKERIGTNSLAQSWKYHSNRSADILASDTAPVVTGPKRTGKKGSC